MPNTTPLSATLRIIAGLTLLIGAVVAGYLARSPWIIAVLGAAFTVSFVIGRWQRWKLAAKMGMLNKALLGIPATFLIQCILVAILYLIGRGIGAIFGDRDVAALASIDVYGALALLGIGGGLGAIVALLERPTGESAVDKVMAASALADTSSDSPEFPITVEPAPITPDRFFRRYAHAELDSTPPATDAQIADAEARLGVTLPEGLKALYRLQDGGGVNDLIVIEPGEAVPIGLETMFNPFSGYNDVYDTKTLQTAWETFLAFADPEEDDYAELFTNGTDKLVVLAQWYQQTLFLDYREPGEPRIGFVDFDHPRWNEQIRFWPNFETFFSRLYHYEDED